MKQKIVLGLVIVGLAVLVIGGCYANFRFWKMLHPQAPDWAWWFDK